MKQPATLDASKVTLLLAWHCAAIKGHATLSQLMLSFPQVTPGMFDEHYVSSSRVCTARSVHGLRLSRHAGGNRSAWLSQRGLG